MQVFRDLRSDAGRDESTQLYGVDKKLCICGNGKDYQRETLPEMYKVKNCIVLSHVAL